MSEGDKLLESFFKAMKEKDSRLAVPGTGKLMTKQRQQTMPVWASVAAVVNIIFFGGFWYWDHQNKQMADPVSEAAIQENVNLMNWETPTDKLMTDF